MKNLTTPSSRQVLSWFWDKEMSVIPYDSLSIWAKEKFEWYSKRFVPKKYYFPENFSWLFLIEDMDEQIYVATQKKEFRNGSGDVEEVHSCIYLYEEKDGKYLGHAETFLSDVSSWSVVWFTETNEESQNLWYWFRRVLLLNALSQFFYKKPLHSSGWFADHINCPYPEKRIWDDLVRRRIALGWKQSVKSGYSYTMIASVRIKKLINWILQSTLK